MAHVHFKYYILNTNENMPITVTNVSLKIEIPLID